MDLNVKPGLGNPRAFSVFSREKRIETMRMSQLLHG